MAWGRESAGLWIGSDGPCFFAVGGVRRGDWGTL